MIKVGDEDASEDHESTEELGPEEDGETTPEVERTGKRKVSSAHVRSASAYSATHGIHCWKEASQRVFV